uniref:Uncharacterized protein n=1 Tax=Denticeps clupeoides TaxID=299321 RepID=A0AAY4ES50_9TELE
MSWTLKLSPAILVEVGGPSEEGLEPLKCQLVLVSEQCERTIMSLQEEEKDEISALKQERQILKEALQSMRERQNDLEVHHLQKDLATQYLLYREEHDANKLLIAKISSNRFETVKKPEVENEDIFAVKLALKVCREDLSKAQVELNRLQAEYGHVVPHRDWQKVDCAYKETLLKVLEGAVVLFMSKRRDSLQKDLDGFREASTPRPQWELCTGMCTYTNSVVFEWSRFPDHLFLKGTGIEVPVYLRYEGQFNNLKLQKADLVRVIKEVMKEKGVEDEQVNAFHFIFIKSLGCLCPWIVRVCNVVELKSGIFDYTLTRFLFCLVISRAVNCNVLQFIVTVEELKTALKTIDPSLDSEALELKLCTAFSVPAEELQNEQPLETEAALQRLSVLITPRPTSSI